MREWLVVVLLPLAVAPEPGPPSVGRIASQTEIASRNTTVLPTGEGLPKGSGTPRAGAAVYAARCAACHGARGEGVGEYPPLVGGIGSLAAAEPVLTVTSYWPFATTVWDYIRRAMPYERPGTLSADEVYAVTAFILSLDKVVSEDAVLDARTLPAVRMPNRDGFVEDPRPDIAVPR